MSVGSALAPSCGTFFNVEFDGLKNAPTPTHKSPSAALPVGFDPNPKPDPEMKATKASILETTIRLFQLCKQFDAEVNAHDPSKMRMPCINVVTDSLTTRGEFNLSDRLDHIINKAELRHNAYEKLNDEERAELGLTPKAVEEFKSSSQPA